MGGPQSGRPDPAPSLSGGLKRKAAPPPSHPRPSCPVAGGERGRYLLLAQGQVQECPSAQRGHVARLRPQHGVEVEHGGLLLAQERIAAGAREQGLTGLTPWRKRVGGQDQSLTAGGLRWA